MTPATLRAFRSHCSAAIRRARRGDDSGARDALAVAAACITASHLDGDVLDTIRRVVAEGPISDDELAMVTGRPEAEVRAARMMMGGRDAR